MTSYHITIHNLYSTSLSVSFRSFCVILFLHKVLYEQSEGKGILNLKHHSSSEQSMQGKESWIFNLELISLGIMLALCNPFYYYVRGQVFSLSWVNFNFLMEFKFYLFFTLFFWIDYVLLLQIIVLYIPSSLCWTAFTNNRLKIKT